MTERAAPIRAERVHAALQIAADALDRELREVRVLDLGAAEGEFAVEFARQGAEVVAIEGRHRSAEKARSLADELGLERLTVVEADVRTLSVEEHGRFDLVLCLGLLYHLDAPAAVELVQTLAEVATRLVVIETHVALTPRSPVTIGGRTYSGRRKREFDPGASREEQERLSRSAIGNPESFWFTRPSLFNLLVDAGFTSVLEVRVPRVVKRADRITLVAFRGQPRTVLTAPGAGELGVVRWPEREDPRLAAAPAWRDALKLRLAPYVPAALRTRVRAAARRRGTRGARG
jgi:SAM-dependent methyltransferase